MAQRISKIHLVDRTTFAVGTDGITEIREMFALDIERHWFDCMKDESKRFRVYSAKVMYVEYFD